MVRLFVQEKDGQIPFHQCSKSLNNNIWIHDNNADIAASGRSSADVEFSEVTSREDNINSCTYLKIIYSSVKNDQCRKYLNITTCLYCAKLSKSVKPRVTQ